MNNFSNFIDYSEPLDSQMSRDFQIENLLDNPLSEEGWLEIQSEPNIMNVPLILPLQGSMQLQFKTPSSTSCKDFETKWINSVINSLSAEEYEEWKYEWKEESSVIKDLGSSLDFNSRIQQNFSIHDQASAVSQNNTSLLPYIDIEDLCQHTVTSPRRSSFELSEGLQQNMHENFYLDFEMSLDHSNQTIQQNESFEESKQLKEEDEDANSNSYKSLLESSSSETKNTNRKQKKKTNQERSDDTLIQIAAAAFARRVIKKSAKDNFDAFLELENAAASQNHREFLKKAARDEVDSQENHQTLKKFIEYFNQNIIKGSTILDEEEELFICKQIFPNVYKDEDLAGQALKLKAYLKKSYFNQEVFNCFLGCPLIQKLKSYIKDCAMPKQILSQLKKNASVEKRIVLQVENTVQSFLDGTLDQGFRSTENQQESTNDSFLKALSGQQGINRNCSAQNHLDQHEQNRCSQKRETKAAAKQKKKGKQCHLNDQKKFEEQDLKKQVKRRSQRQSELEKKSAVQKRMKKQKSDSIWGPNFV